MAFSLLLSAWVFSGLARGASWPDLSEPALPVGGGERDGPILLGDMLALYVAADTH